MREDISYRTIIDNLIKVPEKADTRDTEAVKRISTAYLKLLFPQVRQPADIAREDFKKYCLQPAIEMRKTIRQQLALLDTEYSGKNFPVFEVN